MYVLKGSAIDAHQSYSSLSKIFYLQKWRRQRKIYLTNMKTNWKDSYPVGSGSISVHCALERSPLALEWRPSACGWSPPTSIWSASARRWGASAHRWSPSGCRWSPYACCWSPSAHGWSNSALNRKNCLIKDRHSFFGLFGPQNSCNIYHLFLSLYDLVKVNTLQNWGTFLGLLKKNGPVWYIRELLKLALM